MSIRPCCLTHCGLMLQRGRQDRRWPGVTAAVGVAVAATGAQQAACCTAASCRGGSCCPGGAGIPAIPVGRCDVLPRLLSPPMCVDSPRGAGVPAPHNGQRQAFYLPTRTSGTHPEHAYFYAWRQQPADSLVWLHFRRHLWARICGGSRRYPWFWRQRR